MQSLQIGFSINEILFLATLTLFVYYRWIVLLRGR